MNPAAPARPTRIRARLTAWGMAYLIAGPGIAAAQRLGHPLELPIALWAGMGLAHVILARWNLRGLELSLRFTDPRTREGRATPLLLTLANRRKRLPASRLQITVIHPRRKRVESVIQPASLAPAESVEIRIPVVPRRFGQTWLRAANVESAFPLALYRLEAEWHPVPGASILVWPRPIRLPRRSSGLFESGGRATIPGSIPGPDIRPYRSGDPLSAVCWKSTARTSKMQVRPREPLARQTRTIYIDPSRRTWPRSTQFRKMIVLAAALMEEGYRRRTVRSVVIGSRQFDLRHPESFLQAMDALVQLGTLRRPPLPMPQHEPHLRLLPLGEQGIRILNESGTVLSHAS